MRIDAAVMLVANYVASHIHDMPLMRLENLAAANLHGGRVRILIAWAWLLRIPCSNRIGQPSFSLTTRDNWNSSRTTFPIRTLICSWIG